MNVAKKIMAALCAIVIGIGAMQVETIDVQAAANTKSHTYVQDKKSGTGYPTAVRGNVNTRYNYFNVYLKNDGEYISDVKSSSSNLIAKVTEKYTTSKTTSTTASNYFGEERFEGYNEITFFANKKGTYTLTFTVKNASKKTVANKTVKVFISDSEEFTKLTFNNKDISYSYAPSPNLTKKASGKLVVKAGKEFMVKKIQVGGYNADGTITYKTVKSGSNITLSDVKAYKDVSYSNQSEWGSNESGQSYDYIYPKTTIKITLYDKKLKITYDVFRYIYKQV